MQENEAEAIVLCQVEQKAVGEEEFGRFAEVKSEISGRIHAREGEVVFLTAERRGYVKKK